MYELICTSYNSTETGLVLRNNWIEKVPNDNELVKFIEKWNLPNDFPYPNKKSISNILEGTMELPGVVIHVRIVKF